MEQPLPDSELIVSTPERVSFDYQVAGLGTRAIAQVLDLLIVTALLVALFFGGLAVGVFFSNSVVYNLVVILGSFVIVFGYFWTSEALWSGQTIGKKAFRLRAVGDRGEPLTFMQAGGRTTVRVVAFLPSGYGAGPGRRFFTRPGQRRGDPPAATP